MRLHWALFLLMVRTLGIQILEGVAQLCLILCSIRQVYFNQPMKNNIMFSNCLCDVPYLKCLAGVQKWCLGFTRSVNIEKH